MTYNFLNTINKPSIKTMIDSFIKDEKKIKKRITKPNKTANILAEYNTHNKRQFDDAMLSNYILRMIDGFDINSNLPTLHIRLKTELNNVVNRRTLKHYTNKRTVRLSHNDVYKDDKECEFRLARLYSFIKFLMYGKHDLCDIKEASTIYKSGVINIGLVTDIFNKINEESKTKYYQTYHEFNEPINLYAEHLCGLYLLNITSKNVDLILKDELEFLVNNTYTLPILDYIKGKSIDEMDFIFAYLQTVFFEEEKLFKIYSNVLGIFK